MAPGKTGLARELEYSVVDLHINFVKPSSNQILSKLANYSIAITNF